MGSVPGAGERHEDYCPKDLRICDSLFRPRGLRDAAQKQEKGLPGFDWTLSSAEGFFCFNIYTPAKYKARYGHNLGRSSYSKRLPVVRLGELTLDFGRFYDRRA